MLRMLSSLVTALLLVLGIALWHADEPTRERIGETLTPAVERGLVAAERAAASARRELDAPPEAPPPKLEIPERSDFREAPLSSVASAPRPQGPPDVLEESAQAPAPADRGVDAVDPEEWARLIRRMLALYARVAGE